mmetsp:Transcript_28031/g.82426  ORF Transcript_28031/g.82426 Transcript_28031/m.82426 type:complete len:559 (-) Transcript_28031:669-2345(-)
MECGNQEECNSSVAEWLYRLVSVVPAQIEPLPLSLATVAACRGESDLAVETALYDVIQNNVDGEYVVEIMSVLIHRANEVKEISVEDLRRIAAKLTNSGEATHIERPPTKTYPSESKKDTSQSVSKWLYDLLSSVSPLIDPLSMAMAVLEACKLETDSEVKASLYGILSKDISDVAKVIEIMHELVPQHSEIKEKVTAQELQLLDSSSDARVQSSNNIAYDEERTDTPHTNSSDTSISEDTARQLYDMLSALPSRTDPLMLALAVHESCQWNTSSEVESALYEVLQQHVTDEELVIEIMVEIIKVADQIKLIAVEDFQLFAATTSDAPDKPPPSQMITSSEERISQTPNTDMVDRMAADQPDQLQTVFDSIWDRIPQPGEGGMFTPSTAQRDEYNNEEVIDNMASGSTSSSLRRGSHLPPERGMFGDDNRGASRRRHSDQYGAVPIDTSIFPTEQRRPLQQEGGRSSQQVPVTDTAIQQEGSVDIAEGPAIMVEAYLVDDIGAEGSESSGREDKTAPFRSSRRRRTCYLDGRVLIVVAILVAAAVLLTIYFMGGFGGK